MDITEQTPTDELEADVLMATKEHTHREKRDTHTPWEIETSG